MSARGLIFIYKELGRARGSTLGTKPGGETTGTAGTLPNLNGLNRLNGSNDLNPQVSAMGSRSIPLNS